MNWTLASSELHLKTHAEILYEVLKNTDDLELATPIDKIRLDHRLKEDLGMDSIQTVSVLYELEEKYPGLTEQTAASWKTVRDVLISMEDA